MADKFDLTPVDHDPFEAMGAIPGLMSKPNVLQAGPTSLQGNVAGLGLPAGVLAKYTGEQVDNAYSMATLPGDVALGRTDPNSPEGFGRTMGLAMGLAGGPLASPKGGVRMGFGGAIDPLAAKYAPKLTAALTEWKKQNNVTASLDHSYWGNEILAYVHDHEGMPLSLEQAVEHVKDLAPDSSHAAIDAAAKEYVPKAVELIQKHTAEQLGSINPMQFPVSHWDALPGVKKFLGIEEPKLSHSLTPVEHDPFYGTMPPVDMAALYGGLSMDPAARMERARQLGFNPDQTLFHGRGSGPFQGLEFKDPSLKSERAIFATDDPEIAASYAGTPQGDYRPEIMPMLARMQNPLNVDYGLRDYHPGKMQSIIEDARARGHDSVIVHGIMDQGSGSPQTQYAIFDPKNLRSKFAAFNPAYKDSANLLSTRGGPFALTPVDHDPWEQR